MEDGNESIALYFSDLKNTQVRLSKQDEFETAKLAAEGDKTAIEKLVSGNLRFVIMIAKEYQGCGLALEELISEGNIGLLRAIRYFDAERGYRFLTYAVWYIRSTIITAIKANGKMIRPPANKIQRSENVLFFDDINFEPDCNDDFPDIVMNKLLREELESYLNKLDARTAEIIRYRFGFSDKGRMTLTSIGKLYHLSKERVRQIQNKGIERLRRHIKTNRWA